MLTAELLAIELLIADELLTELELGGIRLDDTLEDEREVATELDDSTDEDELVVTALELEVAALELTPQFDTTPKGDGWLVQVAVVIQLLPSS